MKLSDLTSNKTSSSYDQHSADIIQCPLLNSTGEYYHASQFTKHLSSMTQEGNKLFQIKKSRDAMLSAFWKYFSENKSFPACRYLTSDNHEQSYFILTPDTHTQFAKKTKTMKSSPEHSKFIF